MIRYKGASYSPGDLTPGKNGIKCHVMLLDGKRDTVELNVSSFSMCKLAVCRVEYCNTRVVASMCVAFPAQLGNRMCAYDRVGVVVMLDFLLRVSFRKKLWPVHCSTIYAEGWIYWSGNTLGSSMKTRRS